jgi:hypothetical protein
MKYRTSYLFRACALLRWRSCYLTKPRRPSKAADAVLRLACSAPPLLMTSPEKGPAGMSGEGNPPGPVQQGRPASFKSQNHRYGYIRTCDLFARRHYTVMLDGLNS